MKTSPTRSISLKKKLASRFLEAMKNLNKLTPSAAMADHKNKRHHAIRAAAYASMATAVGPRKVWSRAIIRKITNRKPMNGTRTHHDAREGVSMSNRLGFGMELEELSDVVPGGKAMDSCKLLNETGHYIKCLRAQIEVMRKILDYSSRS